MTKDAKRFLLTTIGLSIIAFNVGFQIGAFDTLFYTHSFNFWVISVVIILANFVLKKSNRFITWKGFIALLSPSIIIATLFLLPRNAQDITLTPIITITLALFLLLFSLPYITIVLLRITQDDPEGVFYQKKHLFASIAIVTFMGVIGFLAGTFHPLFLNCMDFARHGNFIPLDCNEQDFFGSR